ncbi:erythromycin esterase family protein [Mucilaginibacter daejeonensis]|uniref:erythromycin esterase family protein n=1 Tax=Mucilaginibacter daejeonensis TaxID=398049 RepID=UPI001D17CF68|nr:erythromycin esterase family protein [Mucilaginibacter daejeonensis]UEG51919.1 erythromycin esterase family protein [Mucilaginibacter daejeonensis]
MKRTIVILLTLICSLATLKAQVNDGASVDTKALKAIKTNNYTDLKRSIAPLTKVMATKKIVALGEGTHGTAEFYKLRYWITRILVEEKGFDRIAFENDLSDCWLLDRELPKRSNIDSLMKKYLLSIWQNKETKELLQWVKKYNAGHRRKVVISGIDYVFSRPDVTVLKELLSGTKAAALLDTLNGPILRAATFQDEAWYGLNRADYRLNYDSLEKSSYSGYLLAGQLGKQLEAIELPQQVKNDALLAITNLRQAFAPFYASRAKKAEASRDSNMAYTVSAMMRTPGTKMIIWAHDGHVAKKPIYQGAVGGTGGYLRKMFPDQYFVLGTGTATGTFAATTEPRDTYDNPMKAYALEAPLKDSWEKTLMDTKIPAFYFFPDQFNNNRLIKPMRFVGYTPKSGASTYDKVNMSDHFDAFLFISDTHAATPLDQ